MSNQSPISLESIPEPLRAGVADSLAAFLQSGGPEAREVLENVAVRDTLPVVWACSPFAASACVRDPALLVELTRDGSLFRRANADIIRTAFAYLGDSPTEAMRVLRDARRRAMVRIAWRDLAGWAPIEESLEELSDFADCAIQAALRSAEDDLQRRHGVPVSESDHTQPLMVLAMGKLGGRELNFSSDIDLVFVYPEAGETTGPRVITNHEYFTRVGQTLVKLLDAVTEDGFVFRVDMRLRPYGESGPLVTSFPAIEIYLQQQGREWERYAYVKARAVTAQEREPELFEGILRPFVYRRYLDFGVFESLREMKDLIVREVQRRDLKDNVKLGPGGIREIEFVVQAFQLVRGGNLPPLRRRGLLDVLPVLEDNAILTPSVVEELARAYRFLRTLENRIQQVEDRQIHDLPEDDTGRLRLAFAMACESWDELAAAIEKHRAVVTGHFEDIVVGPLGQTDAERDVASLTGVWEGSLEPEHTRRALEEAGIVEVGPVLKTLTSLREGSLLRRLDSTGRNRLDSLVPRLLRAVGRVDRKPGGQSAAIERLGRIIEAVGRRTAYFALLNENVEALERLTRLCVSSDFLARQIANHPLLLDELIDPRIFENLPTREQFDDDIRARLAHIEIQDLERQAEALARFKQAAVFRVAVADLSGQLPLMKVSDRLTDIAELVLGHCLLITKHQLQARYGHPMCSAGDQQPRESGFAIIGYGKLGGLELGYASDLDLVFLHDSAGELQRTDGEHGIDNAVYFARLGQRIVSLLAMRTPAGTLYETDTRLRPSGRAGPLVSSIAAFETYQCRDAWTWEHQALLRARAVAGDESVKTEFDRIRSDVLKHRIGRETLKKDVREMRERMRSELSQSGSGRFDLKQGSGGIADIEFLVQYSVLASADRYPELIAYSDNIRQLEALESCGCIEPTTATRLADIYRAYRERLHHLSLEDGGELIGEGEFAEEREWVTSLWQVVME